MAHALKLNQVSCRYTDAADPLFTDVSLTLDPHECLVITGQTGVGKSSLLRLIHPRLTVDAVSTGEIIVPDEVGYVHQFPEDQFVSDAVYQELAFSLSCEGVAPDVMRKRVAEIAHVLGLESIFDAPTHTLSGGQAQLVHVASELIRRPKLLLLDEPTAQLDPEAEHRLVEILARLVHEMGIALIIVTHNPEAYRLCATRYAELTVQGLKPHEGVMPVRPRVRALKESGVAEGAGAPEAGVPGTGGCTAGAPVTGTGASVAPAPAATRPSATEKPLVEISHAFVRYERKLPWVLRDFSYEIHAGAIQGILGGNGSGKTSALLTLAGVLRLSLGSRRSQTTSLALLPQQVRALFATTTVKDELFEWQARVGYDTQDVWEYAERFGLMPLMDAHPFDLSGGQMQMLGLVKLMLTAPRVILLDEPTKGLDDTAVQRVEDALVHLANKGVACVVATHDRDVLARVCDDVALVFDGSVAIRAQTQEFFSDNIFLRSRVSGFGA